MGKNFLRQLGMMRIIYCMLISSALLLAFAVAISQANAGWKDGASVAGASSALASLRYVATGGTDGGNDCANSATPCATLQHAVDVANSSDEIRVAAGNYTDVQAREGITQVVYISKTVAVRGGYTTTNWITSDPTANPATLDAQNQGRVFYITGDISPTVEGLRITGGNGIVAGGEIYGGGVYAVTATVILSASQIYNNTARRGSGLYLSNNAAVLIGNIVQGNTASGDAPTGGGGVYLNNGTATLNNNTVLSNTATYGGGVYLYDGVATLNGNTISGNKGSSGGGVLSDRAVVALNGNVVVGNKVTVDGGGMLLYPPFSGTVTLSDNHILSNTANMNGGGVSASPNAMVGNIIQGNTAGGDGGGVWGRPARLIGNTVRGNHADGNGGGIFQLFSNGTVFEDNHILDNTAGSDGGGLLLTSTYSVTLSGNIIQSNKAGWSGGGASIDANCTMTNNVITDNRASQSGSGLYLGGPIHLLHTTIARNGDGDGSGIYIPDDGGNIWLTNTVLVSQTFGIRVWAGTNANLNGVLWYSNTVNTDGTGSITVTNEITGNPAFAANGYHLVAGSAAIDKGVNAGVTTDIDGQTRPLGVAPDLGADEFKAPDKRVYLPIVVK